MIDYKALKYYMTNVWQAIDDDKASINELESFIDFMEDDDCREKLKKAVPKWILKLITQYFMPLALMGFCVT